MHSFVPPAPAVNPDLMDTLVMASPPSTQRAMDTLVMASPPATPPAMDTLVMASPPATPVRRVLFPEEEGKDLAPALANSLGPIEGQDGAHEESSGPEAADEENATKFFEPQVEPPISSKSAHDPLDFPADANHPMDFPADANDSMKDSLSLIRNQYI